MALAAAQLARPRRSRRAWVFFPVVVAFAIVIGLAVYSIVSPYAIHQAPPAPGTRGSLVWGDGIFSNNLQMAAWLKQHGGSYRAWKKDHPAAFRLVQPAPKPKPHRAAAVKTHAKPQKAAPTRTPSSATPALAAPVTSASSSGTLVAVLLAAFGILLVIGAVATPKGFFGRMLHRPIQSDREVRLALGGVAIAVLVGVAVGTLLG